MSSCVVAMTTSSALFIGHSISVDASHRTLTGGVISALFDFYVSLLVI